MREEEGNSRIDRSYHSPSDGGVGVDGGSFQCLFDCGGGGGQELEEVHVHVALNSQTVGQTRENRNRAGHEQFGENKMYWELKRDVGNGKTRPGLYKMNWLKSTSVQNKAEPNSKYRFYWLFT